jgi:hypothetical protein
LRGKSDEENVFLEKASKENIILKSYVKAAEKSWKEYKY